MSITMRTAVVAMVAGSLLLAQIPGLPSGITAANVRQALQPNAGTAASKTLSAIVAPPPSGSTPMPTAPPGSALQNDPELELLKAKDFGPKRFCQDLFAFRTDTGQITEGGVGESYVLHTGDAISILMVGDHEDQVDAQVDGRGEILIAAVGSVVVSGCNLAQAERRIQAAVQRKFSATHVSIKVSKLREVRVFVLGEVYRPGSYTVASLNSLINVLSLAGGPNSLGTYRAIRMVRGGRTIRTVDLYALRTKGEGNYEFTFQNGDTLFVPLAGVQVLMEGAFTRVAGSGEQPDPDPFDAPDPWERSRDSLQARISALQDQLKYLREDAAVPAPAQASPDSASGAKGTVAIVEKITQIQNKIDELNQKLDEFRATRRGDHRLRHPDQVKLSGNPDYDMPAWVKRWLDEGVAPRLQFEVLPTETAADLLEYAGGLVSYALQSTITLRHISLAGVTSVTDLNLDSPSTLQKIKPSKGDLLSALPRREEYQNAVRVKGWVRAVGRFARTQGLRVGDLLARDQQVLKDTYLGRGEILRTRPDGTLEYHAFEVTKALQGDPKENLLLADRDEVELYRNQDFQQAHTVVVSGPMSRAGEFPFYQGMRAADLLFRAGVPLRSANELGAELARFKDGRTSSVLALDLKHLLTTEDQSPGILRDDQVNPVLEPDDRISIFEKPDFMTHRVVTLYGEVQKPGAYVLDNPETTLSMILARAGGLTKDAMPRGGMFLRSPNALNAADPGVETGQGRPDPTGLSINEILRRLIETKRQPLTGAVQQTPLLHGLSESRINRLVVDFNAAIKGDKDADISLEAGDVVVIPRMTDSVYVAGETTSPFGAYKSKPGLTVAHLLDLAGGLTKNADSGNLRLLRADGRIVDRRVRGLEVEPGDVVLVPQKIARDSSWQENLAALTPIALLYNAIKK